MASTQPKEQRIALIKENLAEVLNFDIVEKIMDEGVRNPKVYWGELSVKVFFIILIGLALTYISFLGTATTSAPHCGYFVPAIKIAQLLAADCDVTILLADIHAFLDNLKAPIEMVGERARFYRFIITAILEAVGVKTDKLRFVLGSSYQKTPEYVMDVYRMASVVSENDARRAGSETVKQSANPPLSGLLYPVLQILDEQYLDVDCQFGGMDQRKLFIAAKDWLPKLGYREVRADRCLVSTTNGNC